MKNKAAQQLGRLGGMVTSEAKSAAVAVNGRKGGRPASRPLIYEAFERYSGSREYTNKAAAIRAAKREAADGWPSWARDMRTGEYVWESK